jgi:hypothetical protein
MPQLIPQYPYINSPDPIVAFLQHSMMGAIGLSIYINCKFSGINELV